MSCQWMKMATIPFILLLKLKALKILHTWWSVWRQGNFIYGACFLLDWILEGMLGKSFLWKSYSKTVQLHYCTCIDKKSFMPSTCSSIPSFSFVSRKVNCQGLQTFYNVHPFPLVWTREMVRDVHFCTELFLPTEWILWRHWGMSLMLVRLPCSIAACEHNCLIHSLRSTQGLLKNS
jgi:hypothetical protein